MDLTIILSILLVLALIWLIILTYLLIKNQQFMSKLFPKNSQDVTDGTILVRERFDQIVQLISKLEQRQDVLHQHLKMISKDGMAHVQKMAILRYNPYNDTGGDQSFSFVLLDAKLNGMLITSLHSRSSTRVYTKIITSGKSDLELSKEEKVVLKQALEN